MNPLLSIATISPQQRTFTRLDLSVLRAWIQGLPLAMISERYMPITKKSLQILLDNSITRLHASNELALASALRKGPIQPDSGIKNALYAISTLESSCTAQPALEHACAAWFIPAMSARLARNQIHTISDLAQRINAKGFAWWRSESRIGKKAGHILMYWLRKNHPHLKMEFREFITDSSTLPLLSSKTPVSSHLSHSAHTPTPTHLAMETMPIFQGSPLVPIERIRITDMTLSGIAGRNRAPGKECGIEANNDLDAIASWLNRYTLEPHTYRAYRKEAERFLLWAIVERGKALSDLLVEDCTAYKAFLANLNPDTDWRWISPIARKRFSQYWRPFTGVLSPLSQKHALTIITSLLDWLCSQRYLLSNPLAAIPKLKFTRRIKVESALPLPAWKAFYAWSREQTDTPAVIALAAIVLMRDAGLRLHEVCTLTKENLSFDNGWEATFIGKGSKERNVPLSESIIACLEKHLLDRGQDFNTLPTVSHLINPKSYVALSNEDQARRRKQGGYSSGGLARLIKQLFKRFESAHPEFSDTSLRDIHPHALRHTFGRHAVEAGIDLDVIQQVLGHSSLATTTIYTQGNKQRRKEQLKRLV
jgi:integrase/recombinase XerD